MARSQQHTIRQGTSEKHWYLSAGYLAVGILALAPGVMGYLQTGELAAAGSGVVIFTFVLTVGGLVTYPAIFKDAAYLRGTKQWQVKWWYYIGFGLGVPVVVYILLTVGNIDDAGVFAILGHGVSAFAANAHYLYSRHQIVGVP